MSRAISPALALRAAVCFLFIFPFILDFGIFSAMGGKLLTFCVLCGNLLNWTPTSDVITFLSLRFGFLLAVSNFITWRFDGYCCYWYGRY